ncbi:Bacteriophage peptidoglycan hydrolase [Desulfosporosinus acidiphilus SJ4]|uniref:Bacteriophage peptidoglycan hydrolase n=1 Tax=Desulfosporosinus acidiphilus (strain DSM 22704 / JCM 16185 / SJ4) TaxID=646529 RepID=I4DB66_DESAJ|nr:Bacteriophage peptidoglycan hydrolase [Desulfosporosinus acidiphilus]AFM43040.1 Bacteriophage peptidoglycan hydrolase [Desulfosporosinus acidiphilus SJ4]
MKKQYLILIGGSMIIALILLLPHKEIHSVIPVSTPGNTQAPKVINKIQVNKSLKINAPEVYLNKKLYDYLSKEANRQKVIKRALQLNNGQYRNACVYFVAEALRQNGVKLPDTTCNTRGLINQLEHRGWTRSSAYKNLQPGDICFTMDQNNCSLGDPAHSYIFMGWVLPNNYDYAYVCDNQADRYGKIYHERNVAKLDIYNGEEKEPFRFLMRMKGS